MDEASIDALQIRNPTSDDIEFMIKLEDLIQEIISMISRVPVVTPVQKNIVMNPITLDDLDTFRSHYYTVMQKSELVDSLPTLFKNADFSTLKGKLQTLLNNVKIRRNRFPAGKQRYDPTLTDALKEHFQYELDVVPPGSGG